MDQPENIQILHAAFAEAKQMLRSNPALTHALRSAPNPAHPVEQVAPAQNSMPAEPLTEEALLAGSLLLLLRDLKLQAGQLEAIGSALDLQNHHFTAQRHRNPPLRSRCKTSQMK